MNLTLVKRQGRVKGCSSVKVVGDLDSGKGKVVKSTRTRELKNLQSSVIYDLNSSKKGFGG